MKKSETKFYNTSIKMYNSLFKLLEEKDYQSISIKELCENANINRTTFYGHYDNMNQLLAEAKDYVMNKFLSSFEKTPTILDLPKNYTNEYIIEILLSPYLNFVKENKVIFKVFVTNLKTFNVDFYYNSLLNYVLIPSLKKKGLTDLNEINYISKFYLTGVTAIIMEWISKDCIEDINFIANVILNCNKYNIF